MLGVYLHIPFCVKKCFYCDFYSIETRSAVNLTDFNTEISYVTNDNLVNPFLSSIQNEILLRTQNQTKKIDINTIFLGGGTPSILSESQIKILFKTLSDVFNFNENTEVTIECNPGTLTQEKLKIYKEIGINRISIGVQSFVPDELKFLQRIHTNDDVINSFKMARDYGFDNISFDLIFSIPGQSKKKLLYSLSRAIELMPDHISAYSLIFEKGTPLYNEMKKGRINPVDEKKDSEFYEIVIDFLTDNGFIQYEVSNFARNGKFCKHNLIYWHNEEYLAFGPSAHGFYQNFRYKNKRSLKSYINLLKSNHLPTEFQEFQDIYLKLTDTIFLGLRSDGIDLNKILSEFNLNLWNILDEELELLKQQNLIYINHNKISLTKQGYKICDTITVEIISKIEKFISLNKSIKTINQAY